MIKVKVAKPEKVSVDGSKVTFKKSAWVDAEPSQQILFTLSAKFYF